MAGSIYRLIRREIAAPASRHRNSPTPRLLSSDYVVPTERKIGSFYGCIEPSVVVYLGCSQERPRERKLEGSKERAELPPRMKPVGVTVPANAILKPPMIWTT
jgi:hypothetical protein